ncbi:Scavenger receptor class F member 1 [Mizuhopecten yessoensis]|uniref:Scavenger receptor class F member 1 n=1 Tax=Mizuhopecten yessoensis TaxID=6573 RepID=A0A210QBU1_MIZYE|nr:Scavenger receptor class F member 1 [Mizuhopecten yessoensis]
MRVRYYLFVVYAALLRMSIASENLGRSKPTNQSSVYAHNTLWTSDLAVDGCKQQIILSDCCIHTSLNATEAWWQVDLQEKVVVENVIIYNRDEGSSERRLGGYQIYLSNTRYWRPTGLCYEDKTLTEDALSSIQSNTCDGTARYLTIYSDRQTKRRRWYSDKAILVLCEVEVYGCPVGRYGKGTCTLTCDDNCVHNKCHPSSGACFLCVDGHYKSGERCLECPSNCYGGVCDGESGACAGCKDGFYGGTCDKTCPSNCQDGICNIQTGQCAGCKDGFYGGTCDKTCPSNCQDGVCNIQTGQCADCAVGTYGYNCDNNCPDVCNGMPCKQANGACADCPVGRFGDRCDPCPSNCLLDDCTTEGYCEGCKTGKSGVHCNKTCPTNCKGQICEQTSGICAECEPGTYGYRCEKSCADSCRGRPCFQTDGTCEEMSSTGSTNDSPTDGVDVPVLSALLGIVFLLLVAAVVYIIRCINMYMPLHLTDHHYAELNMTEMEQHHLYSMSTLED